MKLTSRVRRLEVEQTEASEELWLVATLLGSDRPTAAEWAQLDEAIRREWPGRRFGALIWQGDVERTIEHGRRDYGGPESEE